MLRVGITGGIGSGKSTVAAVFSVLGIPVYFADSAAKELMQGDENLRNSIISLFGKEAYPQGILDRKYISAKVFNNPENLQSLNALVHPATIKAAEIWLKSQTTPYAMKEAAIIFETGSNAGLDKVIGVYAPADLRMRRVMQRDNITEEKVRERMAHQMDEDKKMALCDYVIYNDESQLLIPQVIAVHSSLLALSVDKVSNG